MAGSLQEAARRLFDCVETMRAEDRPHRAMVAMINLGQLLTDLGDLTSAWEVYQDLVRMPEAQQMSRTRLAMPIMGLGIHLARRDYKAAYLALPAVEEVIAAQPAGGERSTGTGGDGGGVSASRRYRPCARMARAW